LSSFVQGLNRYLSSEQIDRLSPRVVGIAGCGGIGSHVALTLARSGFRHFILADHDAIDMSNLNRQAFFLGDVGNPKVDALRTYIHEVDPLIDVTFHTDVVDSHNIRSIFRTADIVIEAFDIPLYKKMFLEELGGSGKFLVMTNGMAGLSNAPKITIHRINERCYWVGDGITEVGKMTPPFGPRVLQCAGLMASVVLEYSLSGDVSTGA
jgi:sulfur carrier protein ThiS adenylyltransferase